MKLRFYLLFVYVFISQLVCSQNLVANGDFENYSALPDNISQTYLCNGWSNVNGGTNFFIYASPDYFHVSGSGAAQLPNSFAATVSPYSGAAIMGFYTYADASVTVPDYREYISTQLSSPMIIGNTYTVSFWLTNGSANHNSGKSSNHIGLTFSSSPLTQPSYDAIGGTPQLEIPNEVWTTTWQQFSFTFIADSSYQFITIGNFYNDASTSTSTHVNAPYNHAYYFIDKIEIISQNLKIISANSFCLGDSSLFTSSHLNPVDSVLWNFDDPLSGSANTSTNLNPTHIFTNPGTYNVHLVGYFGNNTDNVVKSISIVSALPAISLGNDTTVCPGVILTLNATIPNTSYLWNNGSTNPIFNVSQPGNYWVEATNACGTSSDTIHVSYTPPPPPIFLGNDTSLCQGEIVTLNATLPNTTCVWNNGSANPIFNVSQPGNYWVIVVNGCGSSFDEINVSYASSPPTNFLGNDTTLCQGVTLPLEPSIPYATYLWNDNSTNSIFNISQQGNYWVKATNACGTSSDTIHVDYIPSPSIFLGNDTTLCQGETLTLDASVPNTTCLWNDNSTNPIFNVSQQGLYWVLIINNCGEYSSDSLNVYFSQLPNVNLGNDKILCLGDKLTLDATVSNANYVWQNGSTDPTLEVTQQGIYWVEVTVNNCSATDTITIDIKDCSIALELPNVITANGDGVNELFVPTVSQGIASMKTTIYNRWGNPVFETTKLSIDWDGQDCSDGTYFWIIYYTDENGKENRLDGFVTLIK